MLRNYKLQLQLAESDLRFFAPLSMTEGKAGGE